MTGRLLDPPASAFELLAGTVPDPWVAWAVLVLLVVSAMALLVVLVFGGPR